MRANVERRDVTQPAIRIFAGVLRPGFDELRVGHTERDLQPTREFGQTSWVHLGPYLDHLAARSTSGVHFLRQQHEHLLATHGTGKVCL